MSLKHIEVAAEDAVAGVLLIPGNGKHILITSMHLVVGGDASVRIADAEDEGDENVMGPYPLPTEGDGLVLGPNHEDGWGESMNGLKIFADAAVTITGSIGYRLA